jgi:hypothetical protein
MNNFSLTGKNHINTNNLLGKSNISKDIPNDIKELKIQIMNSMILPIVSKKWNIISENMFHLEKLKQKIKYFIELYKLDELLIYIYLLDLLDLLVKEHEQFEELEQKMYGSSGTGNSGYSQELTYMVYKTTMIRLKPEYEVYDNIYGKPQISKNEFYDPLIIEDIKQLINKDNITFTKIKKFINEKYDNIVN